MQFTHGYDRNFPEEMLGRLPLLDGSSLMAEEGFWPAYFLSQNIEDEDLVLAAFGCSESASRTAYERLASPSAWPVFPIALRGQNRLSVIYRNFPDDRGVDYTLFPGPSGVSETIAAVEGSFRGPGISWPELDGIVQAEANPYDSAQLLLLLAPMYGDGAGVDQAVERFSEALTRVGAGGDTGELAEALAFGGDMWGEPTWTRDDHDIWGCDGEHSVRNPVGVSGADASLRAAVSAAFDFRT